ncbi:LamG domain-containing protein [Pararhodobacter zhoushanensis]|uniref:LamG domain-containing protein n=1 Tax=Pararhodobacter zhoushanensis TaxID=2479545 RepID=A0ABT3H3X6_9RHOB|nr:LamG domain-containing protein [Pararhodobacter zhoushanensis]MCW1934520.1 LamG domain-containing protein [Pararhodobacter zhoushanensis]
MLSLGLGLGLTQTRAGGRRWTPAAIFGPSDTGLLFDARDPATQYLTSMGITNVSAPGNPAGLILSKTPGPTPGPEKLINGDGSAVAGWSAARGSEVITSVGGRIRVTAASAAVMGVSQEITGLVVGGFYRVTQTGFTGTVGNISNRLAANAALASGLIMSSSFDLNEVFIATAETMYVGCTAIPTAPGQYVEIDNMSVREIPGYHGVQPTAGARPTYQSTGLSFDGSDDRLMTTLKLGLSGTIMSRFNGDAPNRALLGCTLGPNGHARLVLDSSGRLAAGVGLQSASVLSAGPDLRNAWHAGAVSWDGTTVKLYLDGSEVYSDAQVGSVNTTVDMAIGALNSGGTATGFWSGQISDALVIDRAATPAEILKLHNHWSA